MLKIKRTIYFLILLAFILSFAVRIFLTTTRRFDPDEFEHLHASWMIHSGFLPYRDFWQNHTPLLYYLIAPAFRVSEEGIPLIFIVRFILSASSLLILWLTYRLSRLYHDRLTSILAAMVLSSSYLFLHKTIEIRPDQFLVVLWLSSLLVVLRSMRDNRNGFPIFMAGVLLGTGMLFTPKALLCLAATFVTFAASWILVNRSKGLVQTIGAFTLYSLGFLVPVAAFAAFYYQKGALHLMLESTVFANLNFPHSRQLTYLLSLRQIILFLFCAAGIAVSLRQGNWHKEPSFLLAVPMFVLIFIFFFLLPTTNPQSALVFVPMMSIYAGVAFKKCINWHFVSDSKNSLALLILAFLTAVLVPSISALYEQPFTPTNKGQLERIDAILKQTSPQDVFFDGNLAYVFRPQAYYYGFLVPAIRLKIERGEITESIPQNLKTRRCKFVIYDDRVSLLPDKIQDFIRNNYIPTEIPDLYVAGKQLGAESFSGRRGRFWIEIPLSYDISVNNSKDFFIDGRSYEAPVFLKAGTHEIISDTRLHSVIIRANVR